MIMIMMLDWPFPATYNHYNSKCSQPLLGNMLLPEEVFGARRRRDAAEVRGVCGDDIGLSSSCWPCC